MVIKQESAKFVGKMREWAKVAGELQGEDLKQKIYDNKLLDACGDLKGKLILDYGAGPAVIASRVASLGAEIKVFDISADMLRISAEKLGAANVYFKVGNIPGNVFDIVLCNLVLCIVPDDEVVRIVQNIKRALKSDGTAFIGFCNPRIFDVPESVIDFRHSSGLDYEENHRYMKTKKEGNYQIEETHRPIGWYAGVFNALGLQHELIFTQEYGIEDGRKVSDFVIFKLRRGEE